MELGDYYAAYIAMKERKKDRTAYLTRLQGLIDGATVRLQQELARSGA